MTVSREIKRAVVTGPTGAIGAQLCRQLISEGCRVYAVVRQGCGRLGNLPDDGALEVVECGLDRLGELPKLIDGADAFFHLAWASARYGRDDMPAQIANISGCIDAVRAAAELGCGVFVGAGSQAEYGRHSEPLRPDTPCFPETGYGWAKLCAGGMSLKECRRLGLAGVWLRVLSVYGPFDGEGSLINMMLDSLLAGEPPKLTAGEQVWDYLYGGDAARAFVAAARHGRDGAVYPVGSGEGRQLREYAGTVRDAVAPGVGLQLGAVEYSPQQVMYLKADISALTADTGFRPEVGFNEGIAAAAEWRRSLGVKA
ncbi:MAG: NAD-dependent epimerase/dehydratase family protein [Ruminococcus sp.]|nr:NAD-dependent epimerase/dehydratase family protein [Ruminococcus sp.]